MSAHASVRGTCPACASRQIIRCNTDPTYGGELHQCKACGVQLVATLSMKRALLVGMAGLLVFFLAMTVLTFYGGVAALAPVWQATSFVALVVGIYWGCAFQIRRGVQYELWVPVHSY